MLVTYKKYFVRTTKCFVRATKQVLLQTFFSECTIRIGIHQTEKLLFTSIKCSKNVPISLKKEGMKVFRRERGVKYYTTSHMVRYLKHLKMITSIFQKTFQEMLYHRLIF